MTINLCGEHGEMFQEVSYLQVNVGFQFVYCQSLQ